MTGVLIYNGRSSYLERIPYDGSFKWLAGFEEHATVFTKAAAEVMVAHLRSRGETAQLVEDHAERTPQIDFDDVVRFVQQRVA